MQLHQLLGRESALSAESFHTLRNFIFLTSKFALRREMEDLAHAVPLSRLSDRDDERTTGKCVGFYSVFDGHGGIGAAQMAQSLLRDEVTSSKEWAEGNVGHAIRNAFARIDEKV